MTDTTQDGAAPAAAEETVAAPAATETADQAASEPATESDGQKAENTGEAANPEEGDGDDSAEDSKPKKKGGGFQKRIDELTREKHEALLREQAAIRQLESIRAKEMESAKDPGPKPDPSKHATLEEYEAAMIEWAKQVGQHEGYSKALNEVKAGNQAQKALSEQATLAAKEEAAVRKHPDYLASVSPVAPVIMNNPALRDFVTSSEAGTEVAYHLSKNKALLHDIAALPPIQAVRELLKLEERLNAPPPPKPTTKAQPPIKPVSVNGTPQKTLGDLASNDLDSYIARRRAQEIAKRKG